MRTIKLTPNTPEWLAHRCTTWNASDAPAALSCSPYKSRKDLIAELASGITPDVDGHTQRRFDLGHVFEELARPHAAEFLGEDLFVVVGVADEILPGMTRPLGASLDGITVMEDINWEHKSLNAEIRAAIAAGGRGKDIPLVYRVQMEQQLMVSGAEKCLFTASEWIRSAEDHSEWLLDEIHHIWYFPDQALRAQIVEAWKLVEADVAAFDPAKHAPVPKLSGTARAALPALLIDARGEIAASNLDDLKAIAVANINSINTTLETDQQFADAESDAKWLRDVSKAMKAGLEHVRAGMKSVDEVMSTLESLDKMAATKALDLEKRVKSEKDARKMALVMETKDSYSTFLDGLNQSLGADYIPYAYDFAPHIKGLKTLDSMRGQLSAALAEQMAKARALSENFRANWEVVKPSHGYVDWVSLFSDFNALGSKPPSEFQEIAAGRIAKWKEQQATAIAEAKALQDAQDVIAQAATSEPIHIIQDAEPVVGGAVALAQYHRTLEFPASVLTAEPAPSATAIALVQEGLSTLEPEIDADATITLGQLNALMAPVKFDAAGLEQLGFTPVATVKGAKLYRKSNVRSICRAVINLMGGVMARPNDLY